MSETNASWQEQNKPRIQTGALIVIIGGSLVMYVALQANLNPLAAVCFALVAVGMAATMWIS